MAGATGGLGRGLDALLGGSKLDAQGNSTSVDARQIDIDKIIANPNQPRKEFAPEALKDLAESIKAKGVIQPVLVRSIAGRRDSFELVAGERRLRASKLAGLTEIPVLVKEMTDLESMAIALIENLQREDLNPIEEAKGFQELITRFGLSQEQLAGQVGKSRSTLSNSMRLLTLAEPIQSAIGKGDISAGHGRALIAIADDDARTELFKTVLSDGLSVRQAESSVSFFKEHGSLPKGEVPVVAKSASRTKKEPKQIDAELANVKARLEDSLGTKVSFSGSLDKGNLTIKYSSEAELEKILALLEV
ncbi:chromosome partitioning protein, ParB family [Maridesulfovibrio ferrireducens]|uniref:Chromosome partitioning protein, ParB family n=1 Tax=Maridesulfovibrio ferrireducens TaxID=246191 RepID=A0A1G9C2K3_9BACT|nr:ParB/RepB/Spo0J family partition protein [Maridesulfovibrio ferrireducens]SDK45866.1 chromosome partitioning protein, ParB family [Maridesulfovibrio ferrireducens]